MTATSKYLNRPLRSVDQAVRDRYPLPEHGAEFNRAVLDGAMERVYIGDGESFIYREVGSGRYFNPATLEEIRHEERHAKAGDR